MRHGWIAPLFALSIAAAARAQSLDAKMSALLGDAQLKNASVGIDVQEITARLSPTRTTPASRSGRPATASS